MLSTYANKQKTHLVVDIKTNGILIAVHSNIVANAICFKMLNAESISIKLNAELKQKVDLFLKPEFDESSNFILTKIGHNLTPQSTANIGKLVKSVDGNGQYGISIMPEVTDEWLALRKQAYRIKEVLVSSELRALKVAASSKCFFGDTISFPFIKKELDKCNPEEDQYTDAIQEWANIVNVSVEEGFEMLLAESRHIAYTINNLKIFWSKRCL